MCMVPEFGSGTRKNSKLDPELIIPDPQHPKEGTPSLQHRYQIIEGFTGIYLEFNVL